MVLLKIEKFLPSNRLDLATIYNNLINLLKWDGKREESLDILKYKQIREENLSSIHPDLASIYNNLVNLLNNDRNVKNLWTII